MAQKVTPTYVTSVCKPPDHKPNRSLWLKKEENQQKLNHISSLQNKKFKNKKPTKITKSISTTGKCIFKTENNNCMKLDNVEDNNNKGETNNDKEEQVKDQETNCNKLKTPEFVINRTDLKLFIFNKKKQKHKTHSTKLKTLENTFTAPRIQLDTIDPAQIENPSELISWQTKLKSKKNYLTRKSMITMSNCIRKPEPI
jgi:hypothetical protein